MANAVSLTPSSRRPNITTMRTLRTLVVSLCFTFGAHALAAGATAIPSPLADLQTQLLRMSSHAPGHVGIAVKDLQTGLMTSVNADANMPAASTIKIPVMVEVFRQMQLGRFDLNRVMTLLGRDRDDGYGDLMDARSGSRYPVASLLRAMIDNSDNTATNMLIRLVGRTNVNHTMTDLGLRDTRLGDDIRSEGNIRSLRSSPADMVKLLESMAHDRLVDPWSSRAMIAILAGQRHNGLIPAPLPSGMQIAHKTGTLHDTHNDVGIVYLHGEPYVIAVMTTQLPTLDSGRRFIRGVSRLAYSALARFAAWREVNPEAVLEAQPDPQPTPALPVAPDLRMWTPKDASSAVLHGSEEGYAAPLSLNPSR